ncbi:hypothetical protein NDU88_002543 [Pleurodeles waltl]|uniref:Uncharacterized protein n=1 Tax=Pleurodeles waltl TaxID=8319 RepID=A0AAV7LEE2_PLEWA|nr:hypothetical protein NDU88_002543 [Pleurodeles waltl]
MGIIWRHIRFKDFCSICLAALGWSLPWPQPYQIEPLPTALQLAVVVVVMEPNKVVEALRILQQEGREDLIKEGVLEQAWVGLKRPKRSSAEGVSAAILACTSPAGSPRKSKKFRAKSISGRKVSVSPERVLQENELRVDLPGGRSCRSGGVKVPRRSGASYRQRPSGGGRTR